MGLVREGRGQLRGLTLLEQGGRGDRLSTSSSSSAGENASRQSFSRLGLSSRTELTETSEADVSTLRSSWPGGARLLDGGAAAAAGGAAAVVVVSSVVVVSAYSTGGARAGVSAMDAVVSVATDMRTVGYRGGGGMGGVIVGRGQSQTTKGAVNLARA